MEFDLFHLLTGEAGEIPDSVQRNWRAFLLSMPRLMAMSLFLPFLRAPQIPAMVRNCTVGVLALLLAPMTAEALEDGVYGSEAGWTFFFLLIKESVLGMILGFLLSLIFFTAEGAGNFIDNQRGASIGSFFNPALGDQSSTLGLLFSQLFLIWFITAGGLLLLADFLFASFVLYPAVLLWPAISPALLVPLLDVFGAFIKLVLLIAGPVVFSMLIAELGLGLVSRFAPQLNVFFLAMPLKSLVAMVVLLLYIGIMLPALMERGLFFAQASDFLAIANPAPDE